MKYTFFCYSVESDGSLHLKWTAPMKDEMDLSKAFVEYTRCGYVCRAEYYIKG